MRQISTIVLGSLASLSVLGAAHAQTYTGYTAVAGVTTAVPGANDLPAVVDLQTLAIRVTTTTGVSIPLTFSGALTANYIGGGMNINIALFPITATQTRVKISNAAGPGAPGIARVEFGTVNSRAGFDIVNASVRTPGSGFGFAPVGTTLAGPSPWIANIQFTNRVTLVGAVPQNDLYKTMAVRFTAPMYNGTFEFVVDTDRMY
jgi:hypothetical protein